MLHWSFSFGIEKKIVTRLLVCKVRTVGVEYVIVKMLTFQPGQRMRHINKLSNVPRIGFERYHSPSQLFPNFSPAKRASCLALISRLQSEVIIS